MSVDVATLSIAVKSDQVKDATSAMDRMSSVGSNLEGVVKKIAAAWASWKVIEYAKEAVMLAARYETLGVVMGAVGRNIHLTSGQMEGYTKQLQGTGISLIASREAAIMMASANIDLAKSSELARIAQDAAVIGNINSSEAFTRMIQGIRSGEVEILKTIGINVNFEQGYAKMAASLGKATSALTDAEKAQARTNQVLAYGKNLSGAYEASMQTMGKQVLSAVRYAQDLAVALGEIMLPIAKLVVSPLIDWLKGASDSLKSFASSADGKKLIGDFVGFFETLGSVIGGTVSAIRRVIDLAGGLSNVLKGLAVVIYYQVMPGVIKWAAGMVAAAAAQVTATASTIAMTVRSAALAIALNAATISTVGNTAAFGGLSVSALAAATATWALNAALAVIAAPATIVAGVLAGVWYATKGMREETERYIETVNKQIDSYKKVIIPLQEQRLVLGEIKKEIADIQLLEVLARKGGKGSAPAGYTHDQMKQLRDRYDELSRAGATKDQAQEGVDLLKAQWAAMDELRKAQDKLKVTQDSQADAAKKAADAHKKNQAEIAKLNESYRELKDSIYGEILALNEGNMAAYVYGLRKKGYTETQVQEIARLKETADNIKTVAASQKVENELLEENLKLLFKKKEINDSVNPFAAYKQATQGLDPLGEDLNRVAAQRDALDMYRAPMEAAGLYRRALENVRLAELRLRAEAGETWAIIGDIVTQNAGHATDAMVNWMDNLDGVGRTWKTLGDTVRSVIADMLIQMQRAIIQQQVMSPLLQWAGMAIGSLGPGASTNLGSQGLPSTFLGTGTGGGYNFTTAAPGGFSAPMKAGGGTSISAPISIVIQSDGNTSVQGGNGAESLKKMGEMMAAKCREVMVEESRQGGLMARS